MAGAAVWPPLFPAGPAWPAEPAASRAGPAGRDGPAEPAGFVVAAVGAHAAVMETTAAAPMAAAAVTGRILAGTATLRVGHILSMRWSCPSPAQRRNVCVMPGALPVSSG